MHKELEFTYEAEIEVSMLNENGVLKPHAYQILFAQIAEKHLNALHLSAGNTMEYGIAWALISMTIEIQRQVDGCETLYAQTWHSQHKGPYWRRELIFRNGHGEIVFKGSTFSVLLDMEKRTIYRKKETPFYVDPPHEEFATEAHPTLRTKLDFATVDQRKVYNSYIDMLGHVNNCRYGEFAYDSFTPEEKQNLASMKHMEIYFASELRCDDLFTIGKAFDDRKLYIRGHNMTKDDTAFDIVLY